MLLTAAPLGLPVQAQLQPAVALACVFFWSLVRPASMPAPAVFLLGLLSDLLGLNPPGVSIVILLAAHGLAAGWRRGLPEQGLLAAWLAFIAIAAAAAALQWAVMSLLNVRMLPASAALLQFGVTAGLYPAFAILFSQANRGVADPGQA